MPIIELQSVDSTNNYARKLLDEGLAQHGLVIFGHEQLAGKGQRDKVWLAEKDSSIILSAIVNPHPLLLSQQFQLSACIAVAVCEWMRKWAGNQAKIKWPNDLYWQDRKAGGILIESLVRAENGGQTGDHPSVSNSIGKDEEHPGNWQWSIVGIGINVNQAHFPVGLINPVSLKQITGRDHDPLALGKDLCVYLNSCFEELIGSGFDGIYSRYLDCLYKRNEKVKLKNGNILFEAIIKKVSLFGRLVVQHSFEEEFDFGAIEWVL